MSMAMSSRALSRAGFAPFGAGFAPALRERRAYASCIQADMHATSSAPIQHETHGKGSRTHIMSSAILTHSFQSALLLVDSAANASVDRRALRDAGINDVRIITSGVEAALLLAGKLKGEVGYRPDVILYHERLADMTGKQFVSLIRLHPLLVGMPTLFIANDNDTPARLDTLTAGGSSMLVRPYSVQNLIKELHKLGGAAEAGIKAGMHNLGTAAFDAAVHRFDSVPYDTNYAEKAFHTGLKALQERKWDIAITAFQRAMRQLTLKGESELGLASAWQGKGDMKKYCHYLHEAGLTFARAQHWHRARVAYSRLLEEDPKASSPFLTVAERHIRAESFDKAAEALEAGFDLGVLEGLPDRLVQACLSTSNPDASVDSVLRALANTDLLRITHELRGDMHKALDAAEKAAQQRSRALAERNAAQARAARKEREVAEELDEEFVEEEEHTPFLDTSAIDAKYRHHGVGLMPLPGDAPQPDTLNAKKMESTFFASFPVLNEVVTVVRVTRNLLHHTKKKND